MLAEIVAASIVLTATAKHPAPPPRPVEPPKKAVCQTRMDFAAPLVAANISVISITNPYLVKAFVDLVRDATDVDFGEVQEVLLITAGKLSRFTFVRHGVVCGSFELTPEVARQVERRWGWEA